MRRFASIGLDEDSLRVVEPLFVALFVPRVIQLIVDPLSFGRLYVIVAAIMLAIVISAALRPSMARDASSPGSVGKGVAAVQAVSLFVFGASVHPALLTLASLCSFGLLADSLLAGIYLAASLLFTCGRDHAVPPRGNFAFYALGALFWNVLTRLFVFEVHFGWLVAALLVPVLLRLLFKLGIRSACSKEASCPSDSPLPVVLSMPKDALDVLTERERQVLINMLSGYSSTRSAEKLHLKPSTVREYLRRSYKKLGVANSDEVKRLLLPCVDEGSEEERVPKKNDSTVLGDRPTVVIETVAGAAMFSAAAFLTVPSLLATGEWSVGDPALYSMGLAALMAGFVRLFDVRLDVGGRLYQGALALSAVGSAVFAGSQSAASVALDTVFYGLLVYWAIDYLTVASRFGKSDDAVAVRVARLRVQCVLVSCFTLLAVYMLVPQIHCLLERAIIAVASLILVGRRLGASESHDDETAVPIERLRAKCMVFGAISGLVCEEVWRSAYWFSFMPAALSFLIPITIASAFLILARAPEARAVDTRPALIAVAVVCAMLLLLAPARGAILAYIAAQVAFMAAFILNCFEGMNGDASPHCSRNYTARDWVAFIIGWGFGVLAGLVGINMVGEVYTSHVGVFGVYGNQTGFELFTAFASALIFASTGLWFTYRMGKTGIEARRAEALASAMPADDDIETRLRAIGMTDLQIQVAIQTAHGASVGEIARTLGYSASAVRQVRLTCYRVFSVHSPSALRDAICAGKPCSQSL